MGNIKTAIKNDGYRDPLYWTYEGLQESIDIIINSKDGQEKISLLNNAIEKYPHYYDFYIELFYSYDEVDGKADIKIIEKGYKLAVDRLKKENGGKLPEVINWYFIENRHIHRIIYNYAECLAKLEEYKKSNKLLNTLLKIHPSDNIGARLLKEENLQKTKKSKYKGSKPQTGKISDRELSRSVGIPVQTLQDWKKRNGNWRKTLYDILKTMNKEEIKKLIEESGELSRHI